MFGEITDYSTILEIPDKVEECGEVRRYEYSGERDKDKRKSTT